MALLIKASGQTETVTPKNGKAFTLQEMQGFVGGYIEAFRVHDGRIMWLNEDGKRLELPHNWYASEIAWRAGLPTFDRIVGDVLVATLAETGDGEDEE